VGALDGEAPSVRRYLEKAPWASVAPSLARRRRDCCPQRRRSAFWRPSSLPTP